MDKKFFRCTVCNDIHYGIGGPEICPTCMQKDVYVEIDKDEAVKVMNLG
ncbi:MAG: hypothetical protein ABIE94_05705 [archaeon]